MADIVRYGSFDAQSFNQQMAKADALAGNLYAKIEVGENVFRFLPPPVGKSSPFRVTAQHYVDAVPGLDRTIVFACPRVELKSQCVVCDQAELLGKSPNPLDRERANRLRPGLRVFANVIDRRAPEAGIRVLAFGQQILNQLKSIRANPRLGGDFTDPTEKGFDTVIIRVGTGKNDTEYTVSADRVNSPLAATAVEMQALIDGQHDLDDQVNPVVPEELMNIWGQNNMRLPAGHAHGNPQLQGRPSAVGAGVAAAMRGASGTTTPVPPGEKDDL